MRFQSRNPVWTIIQSFAVVTFLPTAIKFHLRSAPELNESAASGSICWRRQDRDVLGIVLDGRGVRMNGL